ncbi:MAG: rhodanese-like domain-containing protein [Actinomycetota bacterium]|nr:rhodanese-like domain-containing protein [Actinomycetota bacterium]
MSALPQVVDATWLMGELEAEDLFVGDVRGPNAHTRGHIPGSKPLVLGSPSPMTDAEVVGGLAREAALRLRRHGVTGEERLVLCDRGDGTGAMAAAQLAELAGHPRVAVLAGGVAGWPGELVVGAVELAPVKAELTANLAALPTRDELAARLDDEHLTILDVRGDDEFSGRGGYPCDPRQGHIPGARHVEHVLLLDAPGQPREADEIKALLGLAGEAEIVAYCHSGSRSAAATLALRAAGYRARNYPGSWHEWSRHPELPIQR